MSSDETAHREIRKIAYDLWMEEGQPHGRDREHWEAAMLAWAFRNNDAGESRDQEAAPKTKNRPRTTAANAPKGSR